MTAFRRVGEEIVWERSFLTAVVGSFTDPDGGSFSRTYIRHPGAVAVVPLLPDGETALLVRQYRAAIDDELLELPAGKLDVAHEDPESCARRELEEEVGQRAIGPLELLADFYTSAGFTDERARVYLARRLERCGSSAQGVEEAHLTVAPVRLADVPTLVADGRLRDAKTILGLALARDRLAEG